MKQKLLTFLTLLVMCVTGVWADNVAKIGDTGYATLAAAIAAVQDNETISLLTDVTLAQEETIAVNNGKTFSLDLSGKTITGSSTKQSKYFMCVTNGTNMTIDDSSTDKNGKITFHSVESPVDYGVETNTLYINGGTVTLKNGTIENATPASGLSYAVNSSSNAWADPIVSTFNMEGGVVTAPYGDAALRIYQNAGDQVSENYVNITGGKIKDTGIFIDTYTYQPSGTTTDNSKTKTVISITDGATINGLVDFKLRNDKISTNISGGNFTNSQFRVRNYTSESIITGFTAPIIKISGGKFAFGTGSDIFTNTGFTTGVNPIEISNGLYSKNGFDAAVISGKSIIDNTDTETKTAYPYTIGVAKTYVAQIGNVQYETLAAAIATVTTTDSTTIKLLADINDEKVIIGGSQNINIDLNGYVLSSKEVVSDDGATGVRVQGTLTISDSKPTAEHKLLASTSGTTTIWTVDDANGTIAISGGIVTGEFYLFKRANGDPDGAYKLILNAGNLIAGSSAIPTMWGSGSFEMNDGLVGYASTGVNLSYVLNGGKVTKCGTGVSGTGTIANTTITENGLGVDCGNTVIMNSGVISKNTTRGVSISAGKSFTMNGGEISENTGKSGVGVYVNAVDGNKGTGTFVLNDGEIKNNTSTSNGQGAGVYAGGSFTMNGGSITGNTTGVNHGAGVMVNEGGTTTLNHGTISGNKIESGTNATRVGAGVAVANNSTLNIAGDVVIRDNTVEGSSNIEGKGGNLGVYSGTLNISGGKIAGTVGYREGTKTGTISGGVFDEATKTGLEAVMALTDATGFLFADGKTFVNNTDEATKADYPYTVGVAKTYVAQIGDTKYTTLAAAVAAATEGQTITLLADVEENVTIPSTFNATLDLAGYTINGKTVASSPAIKNEGNLTITDSSNDKKGTIKREDTGASGAYYTIQNLGTMHIVSANVTNGSGYTGSGASLIINGNSDKPDVEYNLTIDNLKFEQQNFIVVKNDYGNLVINGGTYNSNDWHTDEAGTTRLTSVVQNWDKATINGGTFNGGISTMSYGVASTTTINGGTFAGSFWTYDYTGNYTAKFVINDGQFDFKHWRSTGTKVSVEINGGIFTDSSKPSNITLSKVSDKDASGTVNYVADGKAVIANTNEETKVAYPWTIGDAPVCKIGEVTYTTLATAVDAATEGQTIEMLADVTQTETITLTKNIILDLNGKTISTAADGTSMIFDITTGYLNITGTGTINTSASPLKLNSQNNYYNIRVEGSNDADAEYNYGVTIGEDVTVVSNGYFVQVNNTYYDTHSSETTNAYGVTVNINSKSITANYAAATIIGNMHGTTGNVPVINVASTANIDATADGTGLYLAGYGKTIVVDGATVKAKETGIEIRAGELTITGGTFTATATPTSTQANGSGTTTLGSAIAVAQHSTKLPINVNITGGSFNGYSAFYESNPQKNSADDIAKVSVAIKGGQFAATNGGTCTVYSEDKTKFITGGYYSTAATDRAQLDAYVADGYAAVANDGKYASAPAATYPTMIGVKQETTKAADYTIDGSAPVDGDAKTAVEDNTLNNTNVSNFATDVKGCVSDAEQETIGDSKNYVSVKLKAAITTSTVFTSGTTVVKKMTFDVKPVYLVITTNANGTKDTAETVIPNEVIAKGITFRLPVDKNVTALYAEAFHITTSLGDKQIQGDAENGKYIEITSKEFSEFSYDLYCKGNVTGDVYAGNDTKLADKTLAEFYTEADGTKAASGYRATTPNAIMIVDEKWADLVQDETNVIVKYAAGNYGNYYYECPKFVLTDPANLTKLDSESKIDYARADFYTPVDFVAATGSYKRTINKNSNTVCLPFALDNSIVTQGSILTFAYYEPVYVDGQLQYIDDTPSKGCKAYAYFNNRTDAGIDAGTPCLLYATDSYDLTATFDNTEIVANPDNSGNMFGTFKKATWFNGSNNNENTYYGLASGGAMLAKAKTSYAFRSVLHIAYDESFNGGSNHASESAPENIEIAVIDEETGVATDLNGSVIENYVPETTAGNSAVYSVDGKLLGNEVAAPGLYIVNGKVQFICK